LQKTIANVVNPRMDGQLLAGVPSILYDVGLAKTVLLLQHIDFAKPVEFR
jgi:hypothetical protein